MSSPNQYQPSYFAAKSVKVGFLVLFESSATHITESVAVHYCILPGNDGKDLLFDQGYPEGG